jgi:hypothetical protein
LAPQVAAGYNVLLDASWRGVVVADPSLAQRRPSLDQYVENLDQICDMAGLTFNEAASAPALPAPEQPTAAKPMDPEGVFSLIVPFAKGSIRVQVTVTGEALTKAHLARVRRYLELAETDWDSIP